MRAVRLSDDTDVMSVPAALGPGDLDPRASRSVALPVLAPLGPGDSVGEPQEAGPVRPPLGPGDTDPREASRGVGRPVMAPLGPGDTPPGAIVQIARPVEPSPGPGDGPEPAFVVGVHPAFGPGDIAVPRPVIRRVNRVVLISG